MNLKTVAIIIAVGVLSVVLYFVYFGRKPAGENPVTAPVDYVDTAVRQPDRVQAKVDLMTIRNEIRQFQAMNGHYPETLQKLQEWRGMPLPQLPSGASYDYDPETGQISVQPAR